MFSHERALNAIVDICAALRADNVTQAAEIIRTRYPHDPSDKPTITSRRTKRKIGSTGKVAARFDENEHVAIFMRDGFIDRYSGERLVFPGVLYVLSAVLPNFPNQEHGKMTESHQAWWDLAASVNRIIPPSCGGTNDYENLVCTSWRRSSVKLSRLLEDIGWEIYPPGKLENWDGLFDWFMDYVIKHLKILDNMDIDNWYQAAKKF